MSYTLWITDLHPDDAVPVDTDIDLVAIQKIITAKAREAQGVETGMVLRETWVETGKFRVIDFGSTEEYIIYKRNKKK